jgi:peroxiredoxin Q/BCP
MGVERTTFLIDAEGIVRAAFPRVKVDGHSAAVIAALDNLR